MSVSVGDMSHIAALLTRRHPQLELYVYGVQRTTKRLGSKLISAATGTHSMPSQQAAHRPNFDGTRARRHRHCDRGHDRNVGDVAPACHQNSAGAQLVVMASNVYQWPPR